MKILISIFCFLFFISCSNLEEDKTQAPTQPDNTLESPSQPQKIIHSPAPYVSSPLIRTRNIMSLLPGTYVVKTNRKIVTNFGFGDDHPPRLRSLDIKIAYDAGGGDPDHHRENPIFDRYSLKIPGRMILFFKDQDSDEWLCNLLVGLKYQTGSEKFRYIQQTRKFVSPYHPRVDNPDNPTLMPLGVLTYNAQESQSRGQIGEAKAISGPIGISDNIFYEDKFYAINLKLGDDLTKEDQDREYNRAYIFNTGSAPEFSSLYSKCEFSKDSASIENQAAGL